MNMTPGYKTTVTKPTHLFPCVEIDTRGGYPLIKISYIICSYIPLYNEKGSLRCSVKCALGCPLLACLDVEEESWYGRCCDYKSMRCMRRKL